MKYLFMNQFFIMIFLFFYNYVIHIMSLIYQWIQRLTSVYNEYSDAPKPSIDVDSEGNFYVAYACVNPVSGQTNVGLIDVCVAKFDSDGNAIWFRQQPSFDTSQDDIDPDICVDLAGNVYVTYTTSGEVSGQVSTVTTADVVVFKLDTNGDTLWVKQATEFNTLGQDHAPSIDTDGSGNVYVAYYATNDSVSSYYDNIILFKLDTNGNIVWVKKTDSFNTPGGNYSPSLAVDDTGNCYVAYYCDGFPASGEEVVGFYDVVVFKTDSTGELQWIRQRASFDTIEVDVRPALTIDTYGTIYVSYQTRGTTSGQSSSGGFFDIVVFKMDTTGNVVWIKQNTIFNTDQADYATSIGIDTLGMIYVAYSTTGIVSGQTMTGTQDIAVLQMDNDGNVAMILQQPTFNTIYENVYPAITVDAQGSCGVVYYSVNPGLGETGSSQELVVFKLRNLICVHENTMILMTDGSSKPVKEIKRGDIVAPNHQVARLCPERINQCSKVSLVVFEKNALGNSPNQRLIVTPNHPIFYQNARRPAKCLANCPGVTLIENILLSQITDLFDDTSNVFLYDIQFDHEGSYVANGVEVQSRSPYSYYGPLPKELYYDTSLYSSDRVWDCMDHDLPLDNTNMEFNLIMLKNKRHDFTDKHITNKIIKKKTNQKPLPVSIVKYA